MQRTRRPGYPTAFWAEGEQGHQSMMPACLQTPTAAPGASSSCLARGPSACTGQHIWDTSEVVVQEMCPQACLTCWHLLKAGESKRLHLRRGRHGSCCRDIGRSKCLASRRGRQLLMGLAPQGRLLRPRSCRRSGGTCGTCCRGLHAPRQRLHQVALQEHTRWDVTWLQEQRAQGGQAAQIADSASRAANP